MAIESYNVGAAVTTSDTVNLPGGMCDALWIGGAGAVTAVLENGATLLLAAVPAGTLLPLRVRRVMATGTAATVIVALYQR